MSAKGSLAERQEFSRTKAKPQDRFRDRVSSLVMTAHGWKTDLVDFPISCPCPEQSQVEKQEGDCSRRPAFNLIVCQRRPSNFDWNEIPKRGFHAGIMMVVVDDRNEVVC